MSRLWKAERGIRCIFKVLEFITSLYFVFVMYHIGPHWVMLAASLAIPIYGLYLVVKRSVDPTSNQGLHSIPYLRYKTLVKAKIWQRADIAISLSMSVVFCGFSAILFFGYFKVRSATSYFLHAAISSLLLAFLYTFDALVTVCQLKAGSVSFSKTNEFKRSFPNDPKHTVQADFTSYVHTINNRLPNSSSAAVPTILDRLRQEIEAEQKYSTTNNQTNKTEIPKRTWFDEELTNSTSASSTSAQQQIERRYWEENRQIEDAIMAPAKNYQKITYSRFQQIDEPIEMQPHASHFIDSINKGDDELPPPPIQITEPKQRPLIVPVDHYKVSSQPYIRKTIYPTEKLYTQISQNRSRSNGNSETTGTSEEELNAKSRINVNTSTPAVLRYSLESGPIEPRPAPLIFYKTIQAQIHPPVKARMILVENDAEDVSGGSSKSSETVRMDDFDSTRPCISSTLVNMNASHQV